jgi:hypothetical protein
MKRAVCWLSFACRLSLSVGGTLSFFETTVPRARVTECPDKAQEKHKLLCVVRVETPVVIFHLALQCPNTIKPVISNRAS